MTDLWVPTAEWIDPYCDLSDDEKQEMVKQFEPPTCPPHYGDSEREQG